MSGGYCQSIYGQEEAQYWASLQEPIKRQKIKIVYHQIKEGTDCPDGIASAWVCQKKYPNADIEGCWYNYEVLPSIEGYDQVVIADFCFPKSVLDEWSKVCDVVLIDHHKTALHDVSNLSDHITKKFDMNECGATLAWKHFFPDKPIPAFLNYVKDRDLWNFELPNSEEIHEAVSSLKDQEFPGIDKQKHVFAIFDMLSNMDMEQLQTVFSPWGYQLLQPKRKRIAELATLAVSKEFQGESILVVEVPEKEGVLTSDLCSYLYTNNRDYKYVVSYIIKEASVELSFRSNKNGSDFDVSAIAKTLGGGGHRNAAGASVKELPW